MSDDLRIRNLTVRYGDVVAVDDVTLDVTGGSLAALVGPSGCGKTSVLRAIAGFETPAAGTIEVAGEVLTDSSVFVPAEKRRVGMLFQQGALFPHLNVMQNVAFGLRRRDADRAMEALRLVGLEDLAKRKPHELSGGQQQRVALARALAPQPRCVLLDEPFGALDAPLRARLREEVRDILKRTGTTAVLVTHDQEEALSIADEVSVMRDGRLLQSGSPRAVYEEPASEEVARLVGDSNLLDVSIASRRIDTSLGSFRTDAPDGPAVLRIPTESLRLGNDGSGAPVVIEGSRFYGHDVVDQVRLPDGRAIRVRLPRSSGEVGATVHIALRREPYRLFLDDGTVAAAIPV